MSRSGLLGAAVALWSELELEVRYHLLPCICQPTEHYENVAHSEFLIWLDAACEAWLASLSLPWSLGGIQIDEQMQPENGSVAADEISTRYRARFI